MKKWTTARGKFAQQARHAKERGISWELTFSQWWSLWQESGHWEDRGRRSGQYVMCRRGDFGPYAIGNVYIASVEHNGETGAQLVNDLKFAARGMA